MKNKLKLFILSYMILSSCSSISSNAIIQDPKDVKLAEDINKKILDTLEPKKIKIKLKVGIVRNNGDVYPVADTKFNIRAYSTKDIQDKFIKINNPPVKPSILDPKYLNDTKLYSKDYDEWVLIAYKGYQEEIDRLEKEKKSIEITTDLTGEKEIEIESGTWYFTGYYDNALTSMYWENVKFDINESMTSVNLANSNSTYSNNK